MNSLGITIKKLRESRGLTQLVLAQKANIGSGTLGDIESGRNKSTIKTVSKIAHALNLTQEEKSMLEAAFLGKDLKKESVFLEQIKDPIKMMTIPVYSSVAAGCGYVPDAEPIDYISIPEINGDCVGVKVDGDSMEPTFYSGDIVILKKNVEVALGEIGVFINKCTGESLVKRLKKKNGVFTLESDNHIFPDKEIDSDEIACCGKVVNVVKKDLRKRVDPLYEMLDKLEPNQRDLIELMVKGLLEKK